MTEVYTGKGQVRVPQALVVAAALLLPWHRSSNIHCHLQWFRAKFEDDKFL